MIIGTITGNEVVNIGSNKTILGASGAGEGFTLPSTETLFLIHLP
jgi:hypothetical protein